MTSPTFQVINHGSSAYYAAVKLREEILRQPLGLTFSPQELEAEKDHIHIAGFKGEQVISTCVLVPEMPHCKMQRVVVQGELQATGIGSRMMKFCEEYARRSGFATVYCHARDTAVPFYLKNGYSPEGDFFAEDTIPHLKMRKSLTFGHGYSGT